MININAIMEYQWHYDLTLLDLSRCVLIFPVGHPPFGEFIDQPWRKKTRRLATRTTYQRRTTQSTSTLLIAPLK